MKKEAELFALLLGKETSALPELVEIITGRAGNRMSSELKVWHGIFWSQLNTVVEDISFHDSWLKAMVETVASNSLKRIDHNDMEWFRENNKNPLHWTHEYRAWVLCNNLMVQPKPSIEKLLELKNVDVIQGDFSMTNNFKKTGQVIQ